VLVCLAGAAIHQFPLVHFVSLDEHVARRSRLEFNAADRARKLWDDKLMKPAFLAGAHPVEDILGDCGPARQDAAAALNARQKYGHTVRDDSRDRFYFVSGAGRVVAVDDEFVSLSLGATGQDIKVKIKIDVVTGEAVRNATRLVEIGGFKDSRRYNSISEELNKIVASRVLPGLRRKVRTGLRIEFVGCVEVSDDDALIPMEVIPVRTKVLEQAG
jgi:predicted lipoprotein